MYLVELAQHTPLTSGTVCRSPVCMLISLHDLTFRENLGGCHTALVAATLAVQHTAKRQCPLASCTFKHSLHSAVLGVEMLPYSLAVQLQPSFNCCYTQEWALTPALRSLWNVW